MPVDNIWPLLIANLPLVAAIFWGLHKKFFVMGVTFTQIVADKDKEILFREKLRQEALADKAALEKANREVAAAMVELTNVVRQTLELNEKLLSEKFGQKVV